MSASIGSIEIIPEQREVRVYGNKIDLTPKEFELLLFLCKHRGKVLSRQQLLYGVWDYHFFEDTRIVDVHISHLREKIEAIEDPVVFRGPGAPGSGEVICRKPGNPGVSRCLTVCTAQW